MITVFSIEIIDLKTHKKEHIYTSNKKEADQAVIAALFMDEVSIIYKKEKVHEDYYKSELRRRAKQFENDIIEGL